MRRCSLLAGGVAALLLAPSGLGRPELLARAVAAPAPPRGAEPGPLAMAPPDLLGSALRIEVGPSVEQRLEAHESRPEDELPPAPLLLAEYVAPAGRPVAEAPGAALLLLSLAGAAGVSRGRRRSPRSHPHR